MIEQAWQFGQQYSTEFWAALRTHILLCASALALAIAICVPLAVWTSRRGPGTAAILGTFGAARALPSLAVLFLLYPLTGIGFQSALIALTLLACPHILINADVGLRGVDAAVIEAGRGMGMSRSGLLTRVQLPLALPLILGGVRSAAVEVIASATLAELIGAGGLGFFLFAGLASNRPEILLVGAVPIALLALLSEAIFSGLQRFLRYN